MRSKTERAVEPFSMTYAILGRTALALRQVPRV